MKAIITLVSLTLLLIGCASVQLNHNALDLAASLDGLTTKQIIYNLGRTIEDPYAVPSQAGIAAGTVQTTNGVSPTFSVPLNTSSVITNAVQMATATTTTNTSAVTHPNSGISLGLTDNWQQGWTLNPTTDSDQLRRLRALYRYAAGVAPDPSAHGYSIDSFTCEYPIQSTAVPPAAESSAESYSMNCRGHKIDVNPDPLFVRLPSCVLCEDGTVAPFVNEDLVYGFVKSAPFTGSVLLAKSGSTSLYICDDINVCHIDGKKAFHDFEMFVFEADGQSSGSGAAAKSPSIKALGAPIILAPIQ